MDFNIIKITMSGLRDNSFWSMEDQMGAEWLNTEQLFKSMVSKWSQFVCDVKRESENKGALCFS